MSLAALRSENRGRVRVSGERYYALSRSTPEVDETIFASDIRTGIFSEAEALEVGTPPRYITAEGATLERFLDQEKNRLVFWPRCTCEHAKMEMFHAGMKDEMVEFIKLGGKHIETLAIGGLKPSLRSKIWQRSIASDIGVFNQPQILDLRYISAAGSGAIEALIEIPNPPLDQIDREEIIRHIQSGGTVEFACYRGGFELSLTEGGSLCVSSNDPVVLEVFDSTPEDTDLRRTVDTFLNRLQTSERYLPSIPSMVDVTKIPPESYVTNFGDLIADPGAVKKLLIAAIAKIILHPDPLYLKPDVGGGGYMVLRIRKEDGSIIIESNDSSHFEARDEVKEIARQALSKMGVGDTTEGERSLQRELSEFLEERRNLSSDLTIAEILLEAFDHCHNPILEEEIPYAEVDGRRAEFRIILGRDPTGAWEWVTDYTKLSGLTGEKAVQANISVGGTQSFSSDALRAIFSQNYIGCTADIDTCVHEYLETLRLNAVVFINRFEAEYERLTGRKIRKNSLALDIAPAWNAETNALDSYFVEINRTYGFSGIHRLDPFQVGVINELHGKRRLWF